MGTLLEFTPYITSHESYSYDMLCILPPSMNPDIMNGIGAAFVCDENFACSQPPGFLNVHVLAKSRLSISRLAAEASLRAKQSWPFEVRF